MHACPNNRCRFKTNQPGRMSHHLQVSPQCQPGYKAKSDGSVGPQVSFKKKHETDPRGGKKKGGRR